jgi:transcriptional regulator
MPFVMYIPAYFEPDPETVTDLLNHHGAGDLITMTEAGLLATMLPFLFDAPASRPDAGPLGSLVGHVARNNGQWRAPARGLSLAILRGPDAYISPSWYETKREHGRVVPTWNYLTAHVYGELVIHDDLAWLEALVRRLTDKHEASRPRRWSVDDAPAAYVAGQLKAIVGIELRIERIEAKAKLSQNRSEADIDGVIAGLDETGRADLAQAMRKVRR